jgi:hypothetical protein
MQKIKCIYDDKGWCLRECPFRERTFGEIINVGSLGCIACRYYVSEKDNYVICKHPKISLWRWFKRILSIFK